MTEANLFCIKFDFGVPLEDIFPPNDIHPRLYNLFKQTNQAVRDHPQPLYDILSNFNTSFRETFQMKSELVGGKLRHDTTTPAAFFWLLRHFLGVLPLPLFPKFTNGRTYNWEQLAAQCRWYKLRKNYELESEISWWIHQLPKANILLIYRLMAFLRSVATIYNKPDKNNVKCLTFYFSSALFVRPYTPGFVTKDDKLYYFLMYNIIMNWDSLKQYKHNKYLLQYCNKRKLASVNVLMTHRLLECACQASFYEKNGSEGTNPLDFDVDSSEESIKSKRSGHGSNSIDNNSFGSKEITDLGNNARAIDVNSEEINGSKSPSGNDNNSECIKEININSRKTSMVINDKIKDLKVSIKNKNIGGKFQSMINNHNVDENCANRSEELIVNEEVQNLQNSIEGSEDLNRSDANSCPSYEEILERRNEVNSQTIIYQKKSQGIRLKTPKLNLKKKVNRVNKSVVNLLSRVKNEMKEHKKTSKYDLLDEPAVTKIQSVQINSNNVESPNIKYKKLLTL